MKKTFITIVLIIVVILSVNSQNVKLQPNIFMQIESGTTLDMGSGDLIVESDESGDATLIDLGSISYSGGSAKVERYLSNAKWHLISSPVSGAVSGMFVNDYLQYHSESTNLYTEIAPLDTPLEIMQGYALWTVDGAPSTETFVGISNTGIQEFNFTKTDMVQDTAEGWNLIGNPYPSALDWDAVVIPGNLSGAIWVFDPGLGNDGTYRYYINGGGAGNTTTQYIPSGQGFFVRATGGNGTLQLTNIARTFNEQAFYKDTKAEQEENTMLVIKATNGEINTQTAIRFDENATDLVDRLYDVTCITSSSSNVPNIYSYSENQKMSINTYQEIAGHETIPFYVQMGQDGEMTLSAHEMNSIPETYPIYLEDVAAQTYQNLRTQPEYVFQYQENEIKAFKIHFKDVTGIEEVDAQNILAYFQDDYLKVNILSENIQDYHLSLYSLSGQLLYAMDSDQKQLQIPFSASTGIYLLKIEDSKNSYQQKLIKK